MLTRKTLQALRKIFYAVIVDNQKNGLGTETNFDFKYIPDFHTTTDLHLGEEGLREPGIERRNLKTLVIASTVVGVVTWVGLKTTLGVLGSVMRYFD